LPPASRPSLTHVVALPARPCCFRNFPVACPRGTLSSTTFLLPAHSSRSHTAAQIEDRTTRYSNPNLKSQTPYPHTKPAASLRNLPKWRAWSTSSRKALRGLRNAYQAPRN
jgi:hypothetical protein